MNTIDFYDRNAAAFHERTKNIDMRSQMDAFAALLPARAEILDAGCGPGRDLQKFAERGFRVTGCDASRAMVDMASQNTGQTVHHLSFGQIEFIEQFDGIWANASLLHVPAGEIDDAMRRLYRALRVNGVMYMSVKSGDGVRTTDDGRFFKDYSEASLRQLLARHKLELIAVESTAAHPKQLDRNAWLHALTIKRTT